MTMAPHYAECILRNALAMGADEALLLSDRAFAGSDTIATAKTLARAIKKGPLPELILCGKKAIDSETGHIGPQLGALLDIPAVTGVLSMSLCGGGEIDLLRAQDGGIVRLRAKMPVLLSLCNGTEMVRNPTITGLRQSRSAGINVLTSSDLGMDAASSGQNASGTETISIRELQFGRRQGEKTEDMTCGVKELARLLTEEGGGGA